MEPSPIEPLIDDLSTNLTRLESVLTRLTSPTESLTKYAQTLPLLDRAKLLTTTVYTLESLLVNALKLSGTDVKQHPINTELQRLKQYFEKVKLAENPDADKRPEGKGLDKVAAGRFIKAGLAGNERWDRERAAQIERERAVAATKLRELDNKRFRGKKRKFDERGEYFPGEAVEENATAAPAEGEEVEMKGYGKLGKGGQEEKQQKQKHRKKKSSRPPKSSKEALEALLKGPIPPPPAAETPDKERRKKRKKNKNYYGNGNNNQNA